MLEKSYRAKRFDDALAKVKRDLGPDAVIVSTRQVTRGAAGSEIEVRAIAYKTALRMGFGSDDSRVGVAAPFARWLHRTGVPAEMSEVLSAQVETKMGRQPRSLSEGSAALAEALAEELPFRGPLGSRVRAVALVGPTGVGKTTTIAKLATVDAFVEKKQVALVSLDQYRIGGADQLACYAELIGCPMEVAHDWRSLEIVLRRFQDFSRVYIDTAGRSPRDLSAIMDLSECLHSVHEPVEVALCLPAAIRNAELDVAVEVLSALRPTRLVMTKLDEAVFLGSVVAAQLSTGLPYSYFTTGQRVPEDIEIAEADRLAALLCGGDEEDR